MRSKIVLAVLMMAAFIGFSGFKNYNSHVIEAFVSKSKWYKFKSEDSKVRICFPAEPSKDKTEQEGAITYKVSSTVGNTTYFIGYTYHETLLDDPKSLAKISLDAFTETIAGNIMSEEAYFYKKNEGFQAKINIEGKGYVMYKVVIVGQIQCQIVVISPEDDFGPDAERFFKSFKVK